MRIILAISLVIFATASLAQNQWLPMLNNVKVTVGGLCNGPVCPAVEPWTELEFDYRSCGEQFFELDQEAGENGVTLLTVTGAGRDCAGPTSYRTYSLQIDSNWNRSQRFQLVNPIGYAVGLGGF